jgi:hypothetical protein
MSLIYKNKLPETTSRVFNTINHNLMGAICSVSFSWPDRSVGDALDVLEFAASPGFSFCAGACP